MKLACVPRHRWLEIHNELRDRRVTFVTGRCTEGHVELHVEGEAVLEPARLVITGTGSAHRIRGRQ